MKERTVAGKVRSKVRHPKVGRPKPKVDMETLRLILIAEATAMGYAVCSISDLIDLYLDGGYINQEVGRHGVWHFDFMVGLLGYTPPNPGATQK